MDLFLELVMLFISRNPLNSVTPLTMISSDYLAAALDVTRMLFFLLAPTIFNSTNWPSFKPVARWTLPGT